MIGQLTMMVKNFKSINPNSGGVAASATGGKRVNTETCARIAKLRSEIDDLQQEEMIDMPELTNRKA